MASKKKKREVLLETNGVEVRVVSGSVKVILSAPNHWGYLIEDVLLPKDAICYSSELEVILYGEIKDDKIRDRLQLIDVVLSYLRGFYYRRLHLAISGRKPSIDFISLSNEENIILRARDGNKLIGIGLGLSGNIKKEFLFDINFLLYRDFIKNNSSNVISVEGVRDYIEKSIFYSKPQ